MSFDPGPSNEPRSSTLPNPQPHDSPSDRQAALPAASLTTCNGCRLTFDASALRASQRCRSCGGPLHERSDSTLECEACAITCPPFLFRWCPRCGRSRVASPERAKTRDGALEPPSAIGAIESYSDGDRSLFGTPTHDQKYELRFANLPPIGITDLEGGERFMDALAMFWQEAYGRLPDRAEIVSEPAIAPAAPGREIGIAEWFAAEFYHALDARLIKRLDLVNGSTLRCTLCNERPASPARLFSVVWSQERGERRYCGRCLIVAGSAALAVIERLSGGAPPRVSQTSLFPPSTHKREHLDLG